MKLMQHISPIVISKDVKCHAINVKDPLTLFYTYIFLLHIIIAWHYQQLESALKLDMHVNFCMLAGSKYVM